MADKAFVVNVVKLIIGLDLADRQLLAVGIFRGGLGDGWLDHGTNLCTESAPFPNAFSGVV
jgi:hypothetical protein